MLFKEWFKGMTLRDQCIWVTLVGFGGPMTKKLIVNWRHMGGVWGVNGHRN